MVITLRDPNERDEAAWRRLWAGYTRFYETEVPEPVTAATWRRMLDPAEPLFGRLAIRCTEGGQGGQAAPAEDEDIVGFAVCVLHAGTWSLDPLCYLEDLFVDPSARGEGAGRALIEDLIELCRTHGWSRLYWHTQAGNAPARHLYDRFTPADDYVRYRLFLK